MNRTRQRLKCRPTNANLVINANRFRHAIPSEGTSDPSWKNHIRLFKCQRAKRQPEGLAVLQSLSTGAGKEYHAFFDRQRPQRLNLSFFRNTYKTSGVWTFAKRFPAHFGISQGRQSGDQNADRPDEPACGRGRRSERLQNRCS